MHLYLSVHVCICMSVLFKNILKPQTFKALENVIAPMEKQYLEQKKIHLYFIYVFYLIRITVLAHLRRHSDGRRQRFNICKILFWASWNNLLKTEFALVRSYNTMRNICIVN
jgi:hypothetical protein